MRCKTNCDTKEIIYEIFFCKRNTPAGCKVPAGVRCFVLFHLTYKRKVSQFCDMMDLINRNLGGCLFIWIHWK